MKRLRWLWAFMIIALVAAAFAWHRGVIAAPQETGSGHGGIGGAQQATPPPAVAVAHPRQVMLPVTLSLVANVNSLKTATIVPKTSGYLQEVTVRPGDPVQTGQVLAVIDHAALDAQVAEAEAQVQGAQSGVQTAEANLAAAQAQQANAEAQVANAKAGVAKAQAQLADAEVTYQRTAVLVREGALAPQNLDDARATLVSDQTAVAAAQAQVTQAEAQVQAARQQAAAAASQIRTQQAQVGAQEAALQNARIQLQYATITAPFSGVVVSRSLDPGAYVTPGTSTPILTIADLDALDVVVNVGETDLPKVHVGDRVQIQVDAYPGRTFTGRVSRIAGGVDPTTRTVQVEIDIPNPGQLLRPGMYATVQIQAGTRPAVVLPLSALVAVGPDHYVWVVADGKVAQRPVTVGQATGDVVEITGGVTPRDLVVVRGTDLVREGQPVNGVPVPL
jgi:RND family efflux transporter MFP subunit